MIKTDTGPHWKLVMLTRCDLVLLYSSLQQYSRVSRAEQLARGKTYILALKGMEEVSTQLPIIPRGPRRIANAT